MKIMIPFSIAVRRSIAAATGAVAVLLLAGCFEQRVRWSPDGTQAMVLTESGLQLCDGAGRLITPVLPEVYRAAWLHDSQRIVVARARRVSDWATVEQALGAQRAAAVSAQAEELWDAVDRGAVWSVLTLDLKGDQTAAKIPLRERHGDKLRKRLSAEQWQELVSTSVEVTELMVVRRENGQWSVSEPMHRGLDEVMDLRVSPGDRLLAFTAQMAEGGDLDLFVAPLDGSAAAQRVASRVAWYPDWTHDGRCLVSFEAAGAGGDRDALRLGALVQREVVDETGSIKVTEEPRTLAGGVFGGQVRVRCLRDGRILFNAVELTLPMAAEDHGEQREQFFAVDPQRQATLVRLIPRQRELELPQQLAYFEVSPDEREVLFGNPKGAVAVLTLATGKVTPVQAAGTRELQGAPVWRSAGELSYFRRVPEQGGQLPVRPVELIVRRGETETVLSGAWTDELMQSVVK